jgi:hypothetical protein
VAAGRDTCLARSTTDKGRCLRCRRLMWNCDSWRWRKTRFEIMKKNAKFRRTSRCSRPCSIGCILVPPFQTGLLGYMTIAVPGTESHLPTSCLTWEKIIRICHESLKQPAFKTFTSKPPIFPVFGDIPSETPGDVFVVRDQEAGPKTIKANWSRKTNNWFLDKQFSLCLICFNKPISVCTRTQYWKKLFLHQPIGLSWYDCHAHHSFWRSRTRPRCRWWPTGSRRLRKEKLTAVAWSH